MVMLLNQLDEPKRAPTPKANHSAELLYTLQFTRTLDAVISEIALSQQRIENVDNSAELAFDRAIARLRDGLIVILSTACDELGPAPDIKVIEEFISSLEQRIAVAREKVT